MGFRNPLTLADTLSAAQLADQLLFDEAMAALEAKRAELQAALDKLAVDLSAIDLALAGDLIRLTTDLAANRDALAALDVAQTKLAADLAGIDFDDLAGEISAAQIAVGTIIAAHIAAGAVTADAIAADTITSRELAAGAVTADELAAGAITAGKIAAGAIDGMTISGARIQNSKDGTGFALDGASSALWFKTGNPALLDPFLDGHVSGDGVVWFALRGPSAKTRPDAWGLSLTHYEADDVRYTSLTGDIIDIGDVGSTVRFPGAVEMATDTTAFKPESVPSPWAVGSISVRRRGGMMAVAFLITKNAALAAGNISDETVFTMPEGFRPCFNFMTTTSYGGTITISGNGNVTLQTLDVAVPANTGIAVRTCYMLA